MNTLELYQLKDTIIDANLNQLQQQTQHHLKAQGHLPHAPFDDLLLQEQNTQIQPLIETLTAYEVQPENSDRVQLQLDQACLVGDIGNISPEGMVLYHASSAKLSHKLRLACLHLIRQAQGQHQTSYLFDPKHQYHIEPIDSDLALTLLNRCVHYYLAGQRHPLQWDQSLDDYHQTKGTHAEKMQILAENSKPKLFANPYHERLAPSPEYLNLETTQAVYSELLEPLLTMIQKSNLNNRCA